MRAVKGGSGRCVRVTHTAELVVSWIQASPLGSPMGGKRMAVDTAVDWVRGRARVTHAGCQHPLVAFTTQVPSEPKRAMRRSNVASSAGSILRCEGLAS